MLKKVRELLQSMPMGIKVIFLVVILYALLFPRYVAVLPTAFLLDALFLLMLVLKSSQLHLLATIIICFSVAVALRCQLPEQLKNLSVCWIFICTMLAFAYGDLFYMYRNLYVPLPHNFDIPLLLCAMPAWCGIGVGKRMKQNS